MAAGDPLDYSTAIRQAYLYRYSSQQPAAPPQDVTAAAQQYSAGLSAALARTDRAWVDRTNQRREQAMLELSAHLATLPASWGRTLATCTPPDLLVYLEQHWVPTHGGTVLGDQPHLVAAPNSVNTILSHLSTGFQLLGRRGPYDASNSQSTNPVDSSEVRLWQKGYGKDLFKQGYEVGSAVPMSESKLHQLLHHLDSQASQPQLQPIKRLLLLRDALCILYSWNSTMRGHDVGKLTLQDMFQSDGSTPLQLPLPLPGAIPEGFQLIVKHRGTKTRQTGRSDPVVFTFSPQRHPLHCFIARLSLYHALCQHAGHPLLHYLFRPENPQRDGFKESEFSSSALAGRLAHHLSKAGIHEGESPHGCRRGKLQHEQAAGMVLADLASHAQLKTPRVLALYLSPHRHQARQEKRARLADWKALQAFNPTSLSMVGMLVSPPGSPTNGTL